MKIALAMICKASDDEAILLDQCLNNVKAYVDKIFITITGNNQACEDVCKTHGAVVSHFEWINDFAAARNFNWSQVPKEYDYIMWADADDIFRNLKVMRKAMKENPADAYLMMYLYAFDEYKNPIVVHQKTMIVKNDGCVEWAGRLHEDFKVNREGMKTLLLEGVDRIHTSDHERMDENKKRNVVVSQAQMESEPDDPRSHWNLANSLKADNQVVEALIYFQKFIKMSGSDDEKYIAKLRMAECRLLLKQVSSAVDEVRYALGVKPNFPDAYLLLGKIYHTYYQDFRKAIEFYMEAVRKPNPYHSIIVYNPRDYDYVPMINMAKCFISLNRPDSALTMLNGCLEITPEDTELKELRDVVKKSADLYNKGIDLAAKLNKIKDKKKLKVEFTKVPKDLLMHPFICKIRNEKFVKKSSSGKDISFYCGYTEEEWTPKTAKEKGIGGSEEAIIHLSKRLAERGWNVTVYNNCGAEPLEFDGVQYKPLWSFNQKDKQDVVVLWRSLVLAEHDINTDKLYIDLHDVISPLEMTEKRMKNVTKIFVKSNFHRSLFPDVADDKFVVVPNGIESALFEGEHKKDPMLMINTSSPDRSMEATLDCFEKIKEKVKDAKLVWAYGWGVYDVVHENDPHKLEWKADMEQRMKDLGVENLGRISHSEVAELYKKASILLYPSEFAEIDCITLTKALACGCYPLTSNFAAMGEKAKYGGLYVQSNKNRKTWDKGRDEYSLEPKEGKDEIVEMAVNFLQHGVPQSSTKRKEVLKYYNWESITDTWENEFIN